MAKRHDVRVAVHNHSDIKGEADFDAILKGLSDRMAINLDIGHYVAANADPVALLKRRHGDILLLHVKDRKRDNGPNLPFGQGDTPIRETLQLLREERWRIPANIEWEVDGDRVAAVRSASITAGKLWSRNAPSRAKEFVMFGCTSQRGLGALRSTIAVVLMTLLAPVVAWAQQDAGTLRVLIQDAGGVVPGASVVVTNTATNVSVTQVSNDQGYAVFSPIPRGTYTVSATLQGFQPVRVSNVTIEVSQSRLLPVTLAVANVNETIEVTAQSAVIQTEDATLGQVLRSEVIETLPLAGRRYTDLALLTPGATESTGRSEPARPGMAGRQRQLARDEQLPVGWLRQQPEHAEHAVPFGAGGVAVARYAR